MTVFTEEAARGLTALFTDPQLQQVVDRSRIWASEEVLFPTLTALLGFDIVQHPCNYDYIRYKVQFTATQLEDAWKDPRAYWMHSVPRKYDDPLRQRIRRKWNQYYRPEARDMIARPRPDNLLLTRPVISRMKQIEGWLEEDEADLLLAAAARVLTNREDSAAIVEIGSYCGRSTVVLGAPHWQPGGACASTLSIRTMGASALPTLASTRGRRLSRSSSPTLWRPGCMKLSSLFCNRRTRSAGVIDRQTHRHAPHRWTARLCQRLARFSPLRAVGRGGRRRPFGDYADYYPGVRLFVDEILEAHSTSWWTGRQHGCLEEMRRPKHGRDTLRFSRNRPGRSHW